jgi:alkyl hydroperoxide reductase subunit D
MSVETLRAGFGDYAKDTTLNLGIVLTEEGAPDLSVTQIAGIALASAYATKNADVIVALEDEFAAKLDSATIAAARAAATIMAMNNVYYRFIHLVHDEELGKLPAKLRMNVIGNPGIAKTDFELMSLAVSAINGCGMCMETHTQKVIHDGVSKLGVQSTVRIAAVVNAAAQAVILK